MSGFKVVDLSVVISIFMRGKAKISWNSYPNTYSFHGMLGKLWEI